MFGRFFDTSAIDAFASTVAREMARSVPPSALADKSKQSQKRRDQLDERVRREIETLVAANRLNIYQKAKLGTRLQEALEADGYPSEFAKPYAYDVVSLVAAAAARKS